MERRGILSATAALPVLLKVQTGFCRQLRLLWFTCQREYYKCKGGSSSKEIKERKRDEGCPEYWARKLDEEESNGAFLSAIATFIEDAPEIILLVYIIGCGNPQEMLGQFIYTVVYVIFTSGKAGLCDDVG